MSRDPAPPPLVVHGTEIVPSDTRQQYREKIARVTLDSMVQFVGLLDAEGTVVEINKVALDAVGVKLSDVEGKPFWTTLWWQVDRGGGVSETRYFDFVYSAFRGIAGAIEGIFVVASDVTAQVTARQQVNGLRVAAEIANRAKDEFLAMLGHELRNPLFPILTALQLMKLRGEPGSERERTVIERQVNHLTRLVDDLLDVSRIARGRIELKTGRVEMSEMVANAIEMASPLLEQRVHGWRWTCRGTAFGWRAMPPGSVKSSRIC